MIRNYIRMKKNEWKVKAQFYTAVSEFIDNHEEIIEFLKKLYESLKDVGSDEFNDVLINKIIEFSNENK